MYIIELFNKSLVVDKNTTTEDRKLAKQFRTVEEAKLFMKSSHFNLIKL